MASIFGLFNSLVGLIYGLVCLVLGLWMFFYSTMIKVAHRNVILAFARVNAKDELLDIGTGRGLLAIAAAKMGCRVKTIDNWSTWDLGGNGRAALRANIDTEGVRQIDIIDGDARNLPFSDGSFDVVVSNFVVHNIKNSADRAKAIHEMWRVLRPNGRIIISDIMRTSEYVQILGKLTDNVETRRFFYTFPFSRVVVARKS